MKSLCTGRGDVWWTMDCLLSPLGMNKELAGHMVFNFSVSQPDRQALNWLPCFSQANLLAAVVGGF